MTKIELRGFKIFKDRHGRWRCYHRRTGAAIDLTRFPRGSAEFFAECGRIIGLDKAQSPKPGTLGLLKAEYCKSPAFHDLAPRTRADYQRVFDYLKPISDTALVQFTRPLVVRIRDKAAAKHGRRFANYVRAVLSLLFAWGLERGYTKENPVTGVRNIRRAKDTPQANRPWADEEREAVLAALPPVARAPFALMMFCGLGPKDAISLPRSAFKDAEIGTRRSKTGERVFWPAPAQLQAILAAASGHDAITLCASSRGRPWTQSGLNSVWQKTRDSLLTEGKIGPGLTLYGLRHTVAVILREIGYDERTIADALGQKTPAMALHYAEGANLKPKMRGVVANFDAELNKRRTKAVKP